MMGRDEQAMAEYISTHSNSEPGDEMTREDVTILPQIPSFELAFRAQSNQPA